MFSNVPIVEPGELPPSRLVQRETSPKFERVESILALKVGQLAPDFIEIAADGMLGGRAAGSPSPSGADATTDVRGDWRQAQPQSRMATQSPLAHEALRRLDSDTPAGNWGY